MPTKGNRPYDIVIFGATGVVGYYAIRDLYQSVQQNSEEYASVRWAVAGRRMDKLQQTLAELSEELQVDLSAVPKIIADVLDLPSIETMVKSTKVLLNCVGPYNHYGRAVVDACISARTDHFDLSAELQFIEGTQLDCHEAALNAEVIVVSACGFCSIIPEMGLALARQHFNGTLHSVESYIDFKPGKQGYSINFGSFHSIMYFFVNILDMVPIRRRLREQYSTAALPKSRIGHWQWLLRFPFSSNAKGISVVLPIPDLSAAHRTNQYNYQHHGDRPILYSAYYRLRMWKVIFGWPIVFLFWCGCGRALLKRNIDCLTNGVISKNGPSREQVSEARFSLRVIAKGWSEKCDSTELEPKGKRDKKMIIKISGGDPPYAVTASALVQVGLTALIDRKMMPRGGVLTAGSAFRETQLWERLQRRGITWQIEEKSPVKTNGKV